MPANRESFTLDSVLHFRNETKSKLGSKLRRRAARALISEPSLEERIEQDALAGEIEKLEERSWIADRIVDEVLENRDVYRPDSRESWLRDLVRVRGDDGSREVLAAKSRLERHERIVEVEYSRRREIQALEFRRALATRGGIEQRVNPNSQNLGQGGYQTPPLWLTEQAVIAPLAGRPLGNLVQRLPAPEGVHSTNIPRITTSPTVATQGSDNNATSGTDLADSASSSVFATIAGHEDISLQLLDQGGMAVDSVLWRALIASYNAVLENQLINGTGGNNLRGVLNVSSINSVTYTDASPTVPELWIPMTQALSATFAQRQRPAEILYMHPRRWYWLASALDSQNRPLFPPGTGPAFPAGEAIGDTVPVGPLINTPVYLNTSVPTTQGAGSNQDVIIASRPSDCILFESEPTVRVLEEVLSATLQARFELHARAAWHADLYPSAITTITGTGLVAQAGW